ncbi:MAG: carboxypeptidase-like regulatory domain-containing protein [Terriglobales bacterium]
MRFLVRYFVVALLCTTFLRSQTRTTGDLSGVATDPSGAMVPNATITLTHKSTGTTQTSTTDSEGSYRFALLPPGEYSATAARAGFQTITKTVQVSLGGSLTANFQFKVVSSTEVVAVTASAGEIETKDANINTNFTEKQIELQPNPGNDLTAVALTTPGAVMTRRTCSQWMAPA